MQVLSSIGLNIVTDIEIQNSELREKAADFNAIIKSEHKGTQKPSTGSKRSSKGLKRRDTNKVSIFRVTN